MENQLTQTVEVNAAPNGETVNIHVHDKNSEAKVLDYTWTLQGVKVETLDLLIKELQKVRLNLAIQKK